MEWSKPLIAIDDITLQRVPREILLLAGVHLHEVERPQTGHLGNGDQDDVRLAMTWLRSRIWKKQL